MKTYHPDPEINAEVAKEVLEAETIDLAAGYPPRWWVCPNCEASHGRGHFGVIGNHRCLNCGYVGDGGVMLESKP
jgi:rubredoxin